jgi:SAM-dependent methyltransferase
MDAPTSYDTVPYPTGAYAQTHPDRLATVATLFGMSPAPPERCRVLELACGDGGNLLPMAFAMPGSRFLGIDLSSTAIASGRDLIVRAGMTNISLEVGNLMTFEPEAGAYDYVIAHGIYAWVAPPLQDRVLELCRRALAPQGVAIVSYNAYPGARAREVIREMALYHLRDIREPAERLGRAKGLLRFLATAWPEPTDVRHGLSLQADMMLNRVRDNLYHDELEIDYRPAYFHQFIEHAGRHRLQYVGESDFFEMNEELCPPATLEFVRRFGPERLLEKEQYMDFMKVRSFRQTLLCGAEVPLRRTISGPVLDRFLVESRATLRKGDPRGDGPVEYGSARGATMTTSDPFTKRMMVALEAAAPRPLSFAELLAAGIRENDLRLLLLGLYGTSMINLRLWRPPCTTEPGERPEVSRLARLQMDSRPAVTNLAHVDLNLLDSEIRALFRLMDGTRNREALLKDLIAAGIPARPSGVEVTIRHLARLAVLTG